MISTRDLFTMKDFINNQRTADLPITSSQACIIGEAILGEMLDKKLRLTPDQLYDRVLIIRELLWTFAHNRLDEIWGEMFSAEIKWLIDVSGYGVSTWKEDIDYINEVMKNHCETDPREDQCLSEELRAERLKEKELRAMGKVEERTHEEEEKGDRRCDPYAPNLEGRVCRIRGCDVKNYAEGLEDFPSRQTPEAQKRLQEESDKYCQKAKEKL